MSQHDGAAVPALGDKIATSVGARRTAGTVSPTARHSVARRRLDIGFGAGGGGRPCEDDDDRAPPTCCSCLAPTTYDAGRHVHRLRRHARRSRRAPRRRHPTRRGVHRKIRPLRQHRGQGADRRARRVPARRRPGGLGHRPRAVRSARHEAAVTTPSALRRRCSKSSRIWCGSTRSCRQAADVDALASKAAADETPLEAPVEDFYLTNPIARASAIMAECSRLAGRMLTAAEWHELMAELFASSFWTDFLWPLIDRRAEPPAARRAADLDRLHPARRPQDLGGGADAARPQRRRPVRPAAVLRGSAQIRAEGAGDPGRRQQGRVPARAAGDLRPGAVGLGRDSDGSRLGHLRHQCRHSLYLRDLVAGVYGVIMAGWASNSKYPFLAALRSAAQMVSYEVSIGFVIITVLLCAGSLNLSAVVEAQQTRAGPPDRLAAAHHPELVCLAAVPDVRDLLRLGAGRNQPPPFDLLEAESELVAGFMVEYSSTPYLLFMLGEYVAITTMCALMTILFLGGWLPPINLPPFTWCRAWSGSCSNCPSLLHDRDGEGDRAALPLRPADAARLESIPADIAGDGGARRRLCCNSPHRAL